MATKKSAKVAPHIPLRINFYIAEDIRIEEGGKVTAVGLFPDNVVVALTTEDTPIPTKELPLGIECLSFLFCIGGLVGTHKIGIFLPSPLSWERVPTEPSRDLEFVDARRSVNVVGRFRPLLVSSYGKKQIGLSIDGENHVVEFEVRRATVPSPGGASKSVAKPVEKAPKQRGLKAAKKPVRS